MPLFSPSTKKQRSNTSITAAGANCKLYDCIGCVYKHDEPKVLKEQSTQVSIWLSFA